MPLEFNIKPRTVSLALAIGAIFLALQSIVGEYIQGTVLVNKLDSIPAQLFDLFSVNNHGAIPDWYSSLLLLFAAILLVGISIVKWREKAPFSRYWIALSAIFFLIALDEGVNIHQIFSDPIHIALQTSGFLAFGWQIAIAPLLLLFGVLYLRFLFHLEPRTRNLFIISGLIIVGGAFFGDMIKARQFDLAGGITLPYLAIGTVEELSEMLGSALFIYTLLSYMAEKQYSYSFFPVSVKVKADQLPIADSEIDNTAHNARRSALLRLGVIVAVVVITLNAANFYWGNIQQPSADTTTDTTSLYQTILDQYPASKMLVNQINEPFGPGNLTSRQVAASLLTMYSKVVVVVLPSDHQSIFIAGDALPFDRNALSDFLTSNGETHFIVFDTPAVKQIVGNMNTLR